MLEKDKETNFIKLLQYKREFKAFAKKEDSLVNKLDISSNKKERKKITRQLQELRLSFPILEKNLVEAESKMINLDRGLYKGIAINVRDKTYTRFPLYLKFPNLNNHVGYAGTTRVGKTKNMIVDARQLIKLGWDVIVLDPKGGENQEILTEIIQATLEAKRADDFKYLSPAFPKESERPNLIFGMEDEEIASTITTFAESMSEASFFTEVIYENTLAATKSLSFIQAATDPFGEYTKQLEREELERYMMVKNYKDSRAKPTVDRWNTTTKPNELALSSKEEFNLGDDVLKKASSLTLYQNRSMVTFKTLSNYITYKSILNLQLTIKTLITIPPIEEIGQDRYLEISLLREEALSILDKVLATDETNFSKIAKSHSVLLSQLVYGDIGKVFSSVGINPIANRLLSEEKGLVCVMQPFPMKFKKVSNISVMAMLKSIESMMGLVGTSGRGNKRRLAIMIDEAGEVAFRGIEKLFNKAGGLGVTMFVYTQTKEDYALALGDTNANVILDNVNTPITMRMNLNKSCVEAAESLGSVRKHQSMYMANDDGGGRFSVGSEDEAVAQAEDISSLPIAMGYMRHDKETYLVDFPYVKGLDNYPIKMPELESEIKRRDIAKYEIELFNKQNSLVEEIKQLKDTKNA